MQVITQIDEKRWESFLLKQPWSPFLQSYAMGEVYRQIGQESIRIAVKNDGEIVAICLAVEVSARRGKHLMVQYGPIVRDDVVLDVFGVKSQKSEIRNQKGDVLRIIIDKLKDEAKKRKCLFIRISPFGETSDVRCEISDFFISLGFKSSPLHLLAEHVWYLDLKGKTEEGILMGMRKTTRNLVRRAEREGVEVTISDNPLRDISIFFDLYEETCKRHGFVPYAEDLIRAQVKEFEKGKVDSECSLYIARFNNEPVAASVHIHYGDSTSYYHGASTNKYPKCYASYLLQWIAIRDAIKRGDHVYSFWGIAPVRMDNSKWIIDNKNHPFAGVTLFKTGFGGDVLNLVHCMDLPVSKKYRLTWVFEMMRKWKRGF